MSQDKAIEPPPSAKPDTAAITGFRHLQSFQIRLRGLYPSSDEWIYQPFLLISAPAAKAFSFPETTIARILSFLSNDERVHKFAHSWLLTRSSLAVG